jgi:hypothetical protein
VITIALSHGAEAGKAIVFTLSPEAVPPPQFAPETAVFEARIVLRRMNSSFTVPTLSPSPPLYRPPPCAAELPAIVELIMERLASLLRVYTAPPCESALF